MRSPSGPPTVGTPIQKRGPWITMSISLSLSACVCLCRGSTHTHTNVYFFIFQHCMVAVHPAQPQGSALTEMIHARPLEATLHGDASIAGRQGNCWAYSHVRLWHQHSVTDFYDWLPEAKCSQRQKQCGGEVDVNSIVFFHCCDRTLALMLMLVVCVWVC